MWQSVLQVLFLVVGVLIGGVTTWLVSRYYYEKAGNELRAEVTQVRKLTKIALLTMEQNGQIQLSKDLKDEVVGIYVDPQAAISAKSKVTGSATADPRTGDSQLAQ